MIERFQGDEGGRRLVDALRSQEIVRGDEGLAAELAAAIQLRELGPGEELISQGAEDNDMYFLLSGRLSVVVNGREVAVRGPGVHIGEMAAIDPTARRSASVVALEESLVASLSEPALTGLADRHPRIWRFVALELANRLRERSRFVRTPNPRPVIFIGSSKETLSTAKAIADRLQGTDAIVRLWAEDVFQPSNAAIEDLEREAQTVDFALLVWAG